MLYLFSFIFWSIFGSFISVLIHRIKFQEKGIFLWRSKCPCCNHTLSWIDLFPIFSYVFLWWKCRYCKTKISLVYPLLEITTGLVFVFLTYLVLWTWNLLVWIDNIYLLIYAWLIWVIVVAIAFYDILFYEISFILASILAILILIPQILWYVWDIKLALTFAFVSFLAFLSISYIRKKIRRIEWLWWWDDIWASLIWALTPILIDLLNLWNYPSWLVLYIILLLWFLTAWLLSGFLLLYWKISNTKAMIPFLPFMFLAIIVFVFFWKYILNFMIN